MRRKFVGAFAAVTLLGVTAVLAQTVEGIDITGANARANASADEARALADEAMKKAALFEQEAKATQQQGLAQVRAIQPGVSDKVAGGGVDIDELVASSGDVLKAGQGSAPLFMVFVSFSMPEQALRQLIEDTARAGGVVVFRGLPNNSAKEFTARLAKVVRDDKAFGNIGIDPRLFRAFNVEAVPTYVVTGTDFDPCEGLECTTTPPPYDLISGNVKVEYALSTMADARGPGALVARHALQNLGRGI